MALPEIGTLYNPNGDAALGSLPSLWSQPGGPGTPVFPQAEDSAPGFLEAPLQPISQYILGCGHRSNCLAIFMEFDPDSGEQAAIICCPICTYVQLIVIPYSRYEDYIAIPIVVT